MKKEKPMSEKERRAANYAISEHNDAVFDAPPNIEGIKLTRVTFSRKTCHHDEINGETIYLAAVSGKWAIGRFSKQWYGWNFGGFYDAGCQLGHLDILYATDLQPAPRQDKKYIPQPDEDEG